MQQLAQYWNECLKIAEEEKAEANEEIERLQIEMRSQSRKLEEARLRLGQKEVQVNELESQNAELKEHDDGTISQNAKLTEEVDELRKELSDSNTKISHLGEKCKSFKDKINEVLTEQQTLYGQVEASFQAAVTELEREKAKRETDVKEIDSALDLCEKKREEMKREFDDIHARDQYEIQQSKQTISLLTNEIKAQHEEAMAREKDLAENLRRQNDIQYQNGQEKLQHVESKVDLVLDACRQRFQKENENSAPIASISDKIDLVVDVIGSTPSQNQQKLFETMRSAIEPIAQELETRIVSQIDGEFSKYDELEKTISKFAQAFQGELANITKAISWQLEARVEQTSNTDHLHNTIVEYLKDMKDGMNYTKELCEGTRNVQHELNQVVHNALLSTTESERDCLTRKIEERDLKINDLWQQLISLKDDHSAKLEAFNTKETAQEQTIITQLFRDNLHHIGQSLQQEFERERQEFSEKMSHGEKANENLRAQIQEAISKIIELKVSGSPDAEKLEEELQGERHSVASLTRKIGNLEQELKNTEMIRGQWHQGLTSVNTFRAKLEAVAQRLPKVEAIAAKLNGITRLNEVIDSTSRFFDAEKQWLKTELSGRSKVGESNPDDQLGSNMIISSASQDPILKLNSLAFPPELLPTSRKVESLIEENLHAEDASRRKVLVYSPTGDSESPSPPPSIGQEQKRRREAVRPRSILRSSKELLQKMQASQRSEFRGNPMHGSQFNRPVVADTTPGCGNDMANKIINDLQSTLAPPPRFQHGWEFPTVAEFEESVRLGSRKRECEFEVCDNFEDHNKKIKGNNTVISSESDRPGNVTVSPQI
ncbi:unnamed protein product [Clonostachys byssicola]|uniref:Uncharacterized protein n=1 Tax=Clonostachys byssicola TaxID=160290 RepID=A0A9N9Y7K7_9HYPO|nr:unnamed protein product [Clonostachys byssicola]